MWKSIVQLGYVIVDGFANALADKLAIVPLEPARPDSQLVRKVAGAYGEWFVRRGFAPSAHGFSGTLAGHNVLVRADDVAVGVELEMELAHGHRSDVLLTATARGQETIERRISKLFDDEQVRHALTSIRLVASGLVFRFVACTWPDVVEVAAVTTVETVSDRAREQAGLSPYR